MAAIIREASRQDAGQMASIYAPVVRESHVSFETVPPSPREMARRLASAGKSFPWLVCEANGSIAGYAYAAAHRIRPAYQWSVEISLYVREGSRSAGVGRGLYTALLSILALQRYVNAYAVIALPNPASIALHESMGFRQVGVLPRAGYKLGAWHDVGYWHRELSRPGDAPLAPRSLCSLSRSTHFEPACREGERCLRVAGGSTP